MNAMNPLLRRSFACFIGLSVFVGASAASAQGEPSVSFRAEANRDEQCKDPLMGRVRNHLGAAILFDGFRPGMAHVPFRQIEMPSESVFWTPPFLAGQEKQKYSWICAHATPEVWEKLEVTILPEADGTIDIELIGTGGKPHLARRKMEHRKPQLDALRQRFQPRSDAGQRRFRAPRRRPTRGEIRGDCTEPVAAGAEEGS